MQITGPRTGAAGAKLGEVGRKAGPDAEPFAGQHSLRCSFQMCHVALKIHHLIALIIIKISNRSVLTPLNRSAA